MYHRHMHDMSATVAETTDTLKLAASTTLGWHLALLETVFRGPETESAFKLCF